MQELLGRVSAIDPEAGAAIKVVTYFDALVGSRTGLEAVVRAAAVLAGCTAGVDARGRGVLRFDDRGRAVAASSRPRTSLTVPFAAGEVWLERSGITDEQRRDLDRVILERFSSTVQIVLERVATRSRRADPAAVEVLLDPMASLERRADMAGMLGLPPGVDHRVLVSDRPMAPAYPQMMSGGLYVSVHVATNLPALLEGRFGIGPATALPDLPESWSLANDAYRLTTSPGNPGMSVVDADSVTGLIALSAAVSSPAARRELAVLDQAIASNVWAVDTINAIATTASLRAAAASLPLHHSTMQKRAERLSRALGWDIVHPTGRTRLTIAMALRAFRDSS